MTELQDVLDREARRISAAPSAFEIRAAPGPPALLGHKRRRRPRRCSRWILAAVAMSTLVKAFARSEPNPALPPKITEENVGGLRHGLERGAGRMLPPLDGEPATASTSDGTTGHHGVPGVLRTGAGPANPSGSAP